MALNLPNSVADLILGGSADGEAVTITELRAPFRVIELARQDRPDKPVSRASEQRARQSHYPGTQRASTQVMGTREEPVQLNGWFLDPLNGLDVVNTAKPDGTLSTARGVAAKIALLRGIQQTGGLCRLVWGEIIVCYGRVKRADFRYHESARVQYSILFEVDQPDEAAAIQPIPTVGPLALLKQTLAAALELSEAAMEAARTVKTLVGVVR
jgi:hypothetical protein